MILARGYVEGLHSDPVAALTSFGSSEAFFIAGTTRLEARYMATHMHPNNAHVAHLRAHGFPQVTLLDPRTPSYVQSYMKDVVDSFNGISSRLSCMELYNSVDTIASAWQSFRKNSCARKDGGAAAAATHKAQN